MKLTNIKIDEFGCLSGKEITLSPTFNLAVGDNESGKSTLLAFIKFIFYGLPRKSQENLADRERALSWHGNVAAGSITFTTDSGDEYTVERRVTRRMGEKRESVSESIRIIDEKSGLEVHKGEIPGELFLGVPSTVFDSTCFIRQAGVTSLNTADLGSALENILMSADESLDLQRSVLRLDDARKILLHKNGKGGSLYELECDVEDLSFRLTGAKADYAKILAKTDELADKKRETIEKRHELDKLDNVFSAISKAALVKRFDILHECENELSSIENEKTELCRAAAGSDGFLPDADFAASLSASLASCISAKRSYEDACRALDVAKAEKENEKKQSAALCPLSSDEILSMGGVNKICSDLDGLYALSAKKKSSGKALLTLSVISIVLGIALSALSFALSIMPVLFGGIGLAAVGAVLIALGASSTGASKKSAEKAKELSSSIIPGGEGSPSMIRSALLSVLEREEIRRAVESKLVMASSALELRRADLDLAENTAEVLMKRWIRPQDDSVTDALEKEIAAAKEFIEKKNGISLRLAEARSRVSSLQRELDGENEKELRARVPAAALEAYKNGDEDMVDRERRFCANALRSLSAREHELDMELIRLENESENPARISAMLEETVKKYEDERLKYDAIILAMEALTEAGENIRNSVSPLLKRSAEEHMSAITDGKYTSMGIGGDYSMTAATRPIDLLSAGTKDSAYMSLRLALLEVIFKDETPFLAVDEALAQLDDKRAAAALRLLASYCEKGGQCILFTCHTREEKLLEDIIPAEIIRL